MLDAVKYHALTAELDSLYVLAKLKQLMAFGFWLSLFMSTLLILV